jgi:hypothetical protein
MGAEFNATRPRPEAKSRPNAALSRRIHPHVLRSPTSERKLMKPPVVRKRRYPARCDRLGRRKAGVDAASRVGWLAHRAQRAVRSGCPLSVLADVAGELRRV